LELKQPIPVNLYLAAGGRGGGGAVLSLPLPTPIHLRRHPPALPAAPPPKKTSPTSAESTESTPRKFTQNKQFPNPTRFLQTHHANPLPPDPSIVTLTTSPTPPLASHALRHCSNKALTHTPITTPLILRSAKSQVPTPPREEAPTPDPAMTTTLTRHTRLRPLRRWRAPRQAAW
jgi:hypothetical protein